MPERESRLGLAWLGLCAALALHVTDEALTGFLAIYNATVLAARSRGAWLPFPTFEFRNWLTGLICAVVVLFALSPFFFRQVRWIRPLGYFAAFINMVNALGHTAATIFGRTVASVPVTRPAPGFWSSPVLFAAAVWLWVELRKSGKPKRQLTADQRGSTRITADFKHLTSDDTDRTDQKHRLQPLESVPSVSSVVRCVGAELKARSPAETPLPPRWHPSSPHPRRSSCGAWLGR